MFASEGTSVIKAVMILCVFFKNQSHFFLDTHSYTVAKWFSTNASKEKYNPPFSCFHFPDLKSFEIVEKPIDLKAFIDLGANPIRLGLNESLQR